MWMRRVWWTLLGFALVACSTDRPVPPVPSSSTASWQRIPDGLSARTEVAAAVLDGKIFVAGGYRGDGGTVATVEIYSLADRSWSPGPDLPLAVNHAMAVSTPARVLYVLGGYLGDGTASRAAWRLDSGNRWTSIADLPEGRAAGAAAAVGGRIYIAGGIGPGKDLAASMLVYDTGADRWSSTSGPPTRREHLGGAAANGLVYTVGGRTGAGNLKAVESFDPATGQWTKRPDLPTARGGLAAAATCTGQVVAAGGEGAATFPQVELYDPGSDTWRALPPMLSARHGLGVVTAGPQLFTLSGGPEPGLHVAATNEVIDLGFLGACPS